MSAAFVNAGGINGNVTASATPALPGSRVNGNLLLAFVQIFTPKIIAVSAGWTIGDDATDADTSSAWAWRFVDGTETAPAFSWTGNQLWNAKTFQFSGADSPSPFGAISKNSGSGTNLNISALTSTADDSLVAALALCNGDTVIPTPSGYTSRSAFNGDMSHRLADQVVATSGGASDPVSVTINSAAWSAFLIEILAAPPPPPPPDFRPASLMVGL